MIDLLYLSHTAVPAHLEELEGLGLLEPDEQVLVALDGVLLDEDGKRVSGPTLHDYCVLTSMRVLLWGRDYGRHLCYAFPLAELCLVEGVGLDPLHAHLHLAFAAPSEEEQRFTLTLLPLSDLTAAVTLLRLAADTTQALLAQGMDPQDVSFDVAVAIGEQIFGNSDEETYGDDTHSWQPGGSQTANFSSSLQQDIAGLPPGRIYSMSRMGRAAWDTISRALREADLPFNLQGGELRDVTDTLRAINDLLNTVANNPGARDVVMAFLRQRGGSGIGDMFSPQPSEQSAPSSRSARKTAQQRRSQSTIETPMHGTSPTTPEPDYHEIPLRRDSTQTPSRSSAPTVDSASVSAIPLRRRDEQSNTSRSSTIGQSETTIPLRRRDHSSATEDTGSPLPERGESIPIRRRNDNHRPS